MLLKTTSKFSDFTQEKEKLTDRIKRKLSNYFISNSYPEEVIDEIIDENFIASNPSYYLYYPYLFNNYFQFYDEDTLDMLSVSGFLYYKAIILIDDIFDNKNSTENFQKFFIANICQEETVKILSSQFTIDSFFWKTWNIRKFEYAKAYKIDKTLKEIKDYSQFETLADYKSAFGKIALDSLYHLSEKKDESLYKNLLESHKFFYVGFQIMDDIDDYKEDQDNGQFNISRHELVNTLNKDNDSVDNYSLEDQKKLIYIKGVAENLYEKSTNYLHKASEIHKKLAGNEDYMWASEINNLYNTGITHFLNIKGFVNVYTDQKKLSHTIKKQSDLDESIQYAINYITSKQLLDGSWNDILNDAGISDVWATSYTTYSLKKLKPTISDSVFKNSIDYLINNQLSNGLWAYNKMWVGDADSTSFALLSVNEKQNIKKAISEWFKFQNKDGGFTTYNDKNTLLSSLNSAHIHNVDGWLQSHFCVSAVAYLVFTELNIEARNSFENLRNYLISKLKSNTKTLSYWWAEDIYSIYYILSGAVLSNDKEIIELCEKQIKEIIKNKSSNHFFKSLLINTLCLTDTLFKTYEIEIKDLVDQILSSQYNDGSWPESYSLRIPHPSIINTNDEDIIWKGGNKGTNIIVKDYNRIFTTTSCLVALKSYEERVS